LSRRIVDAVDQSSCSIATRISGQSGGNGKTPTADCPAIAPANAAQQELNQ
jgi:hypothetical protein